MKITKHQAICMFIYVDYNEENVAKYKKKIEEFEDVEICYNGDERQLILAYMQKVRGDPRKYRKYLESIAPILDQAKYKKRQRNELRKLKNNSFKYNDEINVTCRSRSTSSTIYERSLPI
jgi:hypothetical protein